MDSFSIRTLFIFLSFFFGSTTSKFTFCSGPSCDPTLSALADIANSFKNTSFLSSSWITSEDYCFWPCIHCDIFQNITTINFRKMSLMGTISPAFANLTALKFLVLDHNNFTGQVPKSLTTLTWLRTLDISDNNISGPLPEFSPFVEVRTSGNPLLETSSSMPPVNKGNEGVGNEGNKARNGVGNLAKVIPAIVVPILCLVAAIAIVFFKHYTNNWCCQGVQSDLNHESIVQVHMNQDENIEFSIQLLQQATNNFDKDNILGRGGCGVVYRGELHNGSKIAIKRMDFAAMETRGLNEFQAEVDVLTRVRHRHLVALLAHCADGNERFLVYEYMPQGTLTQHLFNWQENGYAPLTWRQRIIIALDVAKGVEYLHNLAPRSFIHRDLKPSNILLGDDLRAKVADFGLVKNAPEGLSSVETQLAGTFGYLAPEYVATGRVTTKIDVYAFGAILMEIITGRRALDNSLGEDRSHLVTWLRRVLMNNENIQNVVDQTLNLDEETLESIQKVIELARHCTAHERHHRPDMNYVVNVLNSLVDQWTPTIVDEEEEEVEDSHLPMSLPEALQRWQAGEGTSTFEIETLED